MQNSVHRISLDIHDTVSQVTIYAKKGDTARSIYITLQENGKPYRIAEGCYAVLSGEKPDGNFLFNDCTIKDNVIIYDFTEQTVPVEGQVNCELILYDANGKRITSPHFVIIVNDVVYNDEEIVSSAEATALISATADAKATIAEVEQKLANGEFVGAKGDKGDQGIQGIQGEKGEKGDKGDDADPQLFANAVIGSAEGESVRVDDVSPVGHTINVKVKSKNIIPYPYKDTSTERSGLSYTDNGDGTIGVEGTVTENFSVFVITEKITLYDGVTYFIGNSPHLYLAYKDETGATKYAYSKIFTWSKNYTFVRLYLQYSKGDVVDEVIYPMLSIGATPTEYTPYVDPTTVRVTRCGKNLIPYPYASKTNTINGITFTDNGDGSVTIDGTATADAYFYLQKNVEYGDSINAIRQKDGATNGIYTASKRLYYNPLNKQLTINILSGDVVTNETIYPQIELGTTQTKYESYKESQTYTPNADGTVEGITSLSPTMTLLTNTEGVVIHCEYNRDTNKAISSSIMTADGTVVSQNADFAEVAEWADGNPNNEDRTGYFVCADVPVHGIVMKKATSIDDVKGVSILSPAFAGNYTKDKLDSNGNLLPKYSYVAIIGFVPVRDNGTCTVGGRCMPDDNGCAIPSSNNMGYQVVNRIDEDRVLIIIEPNGDMVQRVKSKIVELQNGKVNVDDIDPTYNPNSENAQSGKAVAEAIDSRIDQTFTMGSPNAQSGEAMAEMYAMLTNDFNQSDEDYWSRVGKVYVDEQIGNIETAIDSIITIQNSLIGGDA